MAGDPSATRCTRRRTGQLTYGPSVYSIIEWSTADDPYLRSALDYAAACALHTRRCRGRQLAEEYWPVAAIACIAILCATTIILITGYVIAW